MVHTKTPGVTSRAKLEAGAPPLSGINNYVGMLSARRNMRHGGSNRQRRRRLCAHARVSPRSSILSAHPRPQPIYGASWLVLPWVVGRRSRVVMDASEMSSSQIVQRCLCRRAERGLHAVSERRYFGPATTLVPKPPYRRGLEISIARDCECRFACPSARERSAVWRCAVPFAARRAPRSASRTQFWSADASLPSVAVGTVRLR